MSIYNPLSSSYNPTTFLSYELFQVTESLITGSSERTPTSSATLYSGSTFILSASAAFTADDINTLRIKITYITETGTVTTALIDHIFVRVIYNVTDPVAGLIKLTSGKINLTSGKINIA